MKKKVLRIALIISMICVSLAVTNMPLSFGNPGTVLAVDPPIVDGASQDLTIGSAFSINVTVHDVISMLGYEIGLYYNTSVLTATSLQLNPPFTEIWAEVTDDSTGFVYIASFYPQPEDFGLDNLPEDPPYPVARIDFIVDAYGFSPLQLQGPLIYDVYWGLIDHVTVDGNFSLVSPTPPVAQFTYSPIEPSIGEPVTFDASASSDSDGSIVGYVWDFGDGTIETGMITAHAYDTAGTYSVELKVTDNEGYRNTATESITVYGQHTDVSGRISTNTTWSLANSPYIVVGDVIVETDIFLTIEPGVIVKFSNGTNLIIDGALIAQGENAHQIAFTSNSAIPKRGDWGTIRFRATSIDKACIIAWAMIEYASSGITLYDSGPRIDNSIIRFNIKGVYSESNGIARIFDSEFLNNTYGITGSFYYYYYESGPRSTVSNSRIFGNTYGIEVSGGSLLVRQSSISHNTYGITSSTYDATEIWETTISRNTYGIWTRYSYYGAFKIIGSNISDNFYGIIASSATISKSIISNNNGTGVSPYFYKYGDTTYYSEGTFAITYSTVAGNKENGIVSKGSGTNTIRFSNIYGNTPYDVTNLAPYERNADVNATNNWWGTTSDSEIDEHIYDYYDDFNLRRVNYEPFLSSPVAIPPIAHDLAIVNVTSSPTTVEKWQSVYVNVYVVNHGDFSENVTVIARYDSFEIGTWRYYYGLMPSGGSATASFYWNVGSNPGGNYTISAEVNAVPGETDTADNFYIDGVVTVIGPPPQHDIAVTYVYAYPASVRQGERFNITVSVQNQGSFAETFTVTAYYDNSIIESKNVANLAAGASTTLTFTWNTSDVAGGNYQIKALATTVIGETDTSDNAYFDGTVTIIGPQPPRADFYCSPDRPTVGDSVYFSAYSSYDPDGYIVSYAWDFGDGTTITATSPYWTHVYSDYGNFVVILTVTDNTNQTGSMTRAIKVNTPPVANFRWTPEEIRANETVTFESLSYDPDGSIVSCQWSFGDGTIAHDSVTQHVYTQIRTYWVDLYVTDNDGRGSSFGTQITVLPKLTMSTTPDEGIVGTMVTITGTNATPMGTVNVYWGSYLPEYNYYHLSYTLVGTTTADPDGEFSHSFKVPPSMLGSHFVRAKDLTTGNYDEKTFNVLPHMTADLTSGPVGSRVTLKGTGFPYQMGPGLSYLMFDDQILGFAMANENGEMQASINIPFASLGPHAIKALVTTSYPYPGSPQRYTVEAAFIIIDTTDLEVTADVGAFYFKGETAEFYVKTALKGKRTDATSISVRLRLYNGTTRILSPQRMETGVYKMSYAISGKGSMIGTYNIIVDASYTTETIASYGTAINAFVVKPTWEKEAPRIAALSLTSIGLISAIILVWRKEKKRYL